MGGVLGRIKAQPRRVGMKSDGPTHCKPPIPDAGTTCFEAYELDQERFIWISFESTVCNMRTSSDGVVFIPRGITEKGADGFAFLRWPRNGGFRRGGPERFPERRFPRARSLFLRLSSRRCHRPRRGGSLTISSMSRSGWSPTSGTLFNRRRRRWASVRRACETGMPSSLRSRCRVMNTPRWRICARRISGCVSN